MIALYLNWNHITKTIEVDAASPTSRDAIQESPELQERISEAMVKVWKELGNKPYVPQRVTDKGVQLIPAKGTWNMRMVIHAFQRELGDNFTVGERPNA